MEYFNNVFPTILDFEYISCIAAYGGKVLEFRQKDLNLCSEDEGSHRCKMTQGGVINDIIFIFWWNKPSSMILSSNWKKLKIIKETILVLSANWLSMH